MDRGVGTVNSRTIRKWKTGVSILVLVDRGVGTLIAVRAIFARSKFQSLFWWIEGLGLTPVNPNNIDPHVSILVLVDRGVGTALPPH